MTLPRTAAEVLSGHVMLEVRCIDRVMLTLRQPRLPVNGDDLRHRSCASSAAAPGAERI
jgi:hypothetical protein